MHPSLSFDSNFFIFTLEQSINTNFACLANLSCMLSYTIFPHLLEITPYSAGDEERYSDEDGYGGGGGRWGRGGGGDRASMGRGRRGFSR